MVKFYVKLSKAQRAVFDAGYWIAFLLLILFMNDQFGIVVLNAESGMPEFHFDTTGKMLCVFVTAVLFPSVRILLYKGEKTMAFNYQNKKNQPPADPFLADDDDLDYNEIDFADDQEEEEPVRRGKKWRRTAEDAPKALPVMQGIGAVKYLHQNEYDGASDERRKFMKDICNTYIVKIDEEIEADGQKYEVPFEFQTFYLHFEFKNPMDGQTQFTGDIVDKIEFYLVNAENNEIVMQAKGLYRLNAKNKQKTDTFTFKLILCYDDSGLINAVKLGYEEERISILNISYFIKQIVGKLIGRNAANEEMANINNGMGGKIDFPHTTRKHHLNAVGTKPVRFCNANGDPLSYTMDVQCFKSFCSIKCPVCGKTVEGLGVPGIVLYNSSNNQALRTSDKLYEYLTTAKNEKNTAPEPELIRNVYEITKASYAAITREKCSEDITLSDCKSNIRIPLGIRDPKQKDFTIIPYTYEQIEQEKRLLYLLNQNMCRNPKKQFSATGLYLFHPLEDRTEDNTDIHNTMIRQLCSSCFNPLPTDFYLYDSVVTLYFYGNANAGKTVLILSEKNEIRNAEFNNLYVSYNAADAQKDESKLDYQEKAKRLENGQFPLGTLESEIIPGLLSAFKQGENGKDHKILFNYYDMTGSKAAANWFDPRNAVYVHAMNADPSSLNNESIYQTLRSLLGGGNTDERKYNIQFFLTKIDEYPAFLYKKIMAHNQKYKDTIDGFVKNGSVHMINHKFILKYSIELLQILEESLYEDFTGRRADEIISEQIQTELKKIEGLGALDFSRGYNEVHREIYDICRPITNEKNELKRQLGESVFRYLHGLDVIRDNYFMFRSLVRDLLRNMKNNIEHNRNSCFYFSVYAVSATGYTAIESFNREIENEKAKYAPQFVKEANMMLQKSTSDYIRDAQNLQKKMAGLAADDCGCCCDHLFSDGGFCDKIEEMYRAEMELSVLYNKDIIALEGLGDNNAAKLAAWYLKTQKTDASSSMKPQTVPAAQGGGNTDNPINASEIAAPPNTDPGNGTAVSAKKRIMRD